MAETSTFAVVAGQAWQEEGALATEATAIIVSDGRIAEVLPADRLPDGIERHEFPGGTAIPGLINLHSHMVPRSGHVVERVLLAEQKAKRDLRAGITTSRDLGGPDGLDVGLRDNITAGLAQGPELIVAARPITRTGGHNNYFGFEADGVEGVTAAVRRQVKAGANCIKLMASEGWNHPDPHRLGLTTQEMRAAVEEAHRLGLRVTVHAQGPRATENSLRAGVDSVEHATDSITDEVIQLFLDTGTLLDSTSSSAWVAAFGEPSATLPPSVVAAAARQAKSEAKGLARCVQAGVRISGATDMYGTMVAQFRLMIEAGMEPGRALAGLTSLPAAALGRTDIGRLVPGCRADIVILAGNPIKRADDLADVSAVYQSGLRVC